MPAKPGQPRAARPPCRWRRASGRCSQGRPGSTGRTRSPCSAWSRPRASRRSLSGSGSSSTWPMRAISTTSGASRCCGTACGASATRRSRPPSPPRTASRRCSRASRAARWRSAGSSATPPRCTIQAGAGSASRRSRGASPTTRWSVWRARSTCRPDARWRRWTARMPHRGIRAAAHRGRSPPARRRARSRGWPASWRRARTRRRTGSTPPHARPLWDAASLPGSTRSPLPSPTPSSTRRREHCAPTSRTASGCGSRSPAAAAAPLAGC